MRPLLKTFKALSDAYRLRIIWMLEDKPLGVCAIKDVPGLANSTVPKHLSLLRDAERVHDEKAAKWAYYSLSKKPKEKYVNCLLPLVDECLEGHSPRYAKVHGRPNPASATVVRFDFFWQLNSLLHVL